jgi:hypothetical protein
LATRKAECRVADPPPGPGFDTVTSLKPGLAPSAIVISTASEAPDALTDRIPMLSPKLTVDSSLRRPSPKSVTVVFFPRVPNDGDMRVSVGAGFGGFSTSKTLLRVAVPVEVVREMSRIPLVAPTSIEMSTEHRSGEFTLTEFTEMPSPLKTISLMP